MKVVIFGSQGMLGTALVKVFSSRHNVHALDRTDIDVTDATALEVILTNLRPDLVINATAFNSVDEAEKSDVTFNLARRINGESVGSLVKIVNHLGVPLVHFSTEYVFNGENKEGYAEDAVPSPINRYGATKVLGEKLLQENTDRFYLVRLSRMFGPPGQSPTAKKSFVDIMIDLVEKQGKQELRIVDEEISCPTYSIDVAQVVFDLTTNKKPFGIYHAAGSGACTWFELASEIFKLKKLSVKAIPVKGSEFPRPAKRPQFTKLLNTKLPPNRSWQEALREYLLL